MKIKVTLDGGAGELASAIVESPDATTADDLSDQIIDVISEWTLSAGDTIKIEEQEG